MELSQILVRFSHLDFYRTSLKSYFIYIFHLRNLLKFTGVCSKRTQMLYICSNRIQINLIAIILGINNTVPHRGPKNQICLNWITSKWQNYEHESY
jgi:hypothetical protein